MNTELFQQVQTLLCRELDVAPEAANPDATLIEDLGADSLDLVSLALAVEDNFQLEIGASDLLVLKTVGDVLAYLKARVPSA